MMRKTLGMICALLLLTGSSALADEYAGDGTYLLLSVKGAFDVDAGQPEDNDDAGIGVLLGTFITPHIAMEAMYDWAHDIGHVATYNVKILASTQRVQPYVYSGIGFGSVEPSELAGAWRAGAGFDIYLTDSLKINTDVTYADMLSNKASLQHIFVGLGIGYHFY